MLPTLNNAVFLDTETTGLGDDDQVVEIALINTAATYFCAMQAYAEYWGNYDYYYGKFRWQSLSKAIRQQGLRLPTGMRLHSALADAEMTRQLVLKMSEVK